MPDVQTDAAPDVSSLYGAPNALDPKITSGLADLQRRKISADTASEAHIEKTLDEDSAMMKHALSREGASANDIKPWNAEAEQRKTAYDPVEAFGSLGSVFALLASAFTHQPMENALNGAAAAMNAVKQGKTEEYQRAYEAWKANTDLALKRHQMMHENYVDAAELLKTNLAAGRAKMAADAAKFGDQKTLFLLEHGMDKELIDLQMARENSALKLAEAMPKIEEDHIKLNSLLDMKDENGKQLYDPKQPGSPRSQRAIKAWHEMWSPYAGRPMSADQQFLEQYKSEHPNATAEDTVKAFGEWKRAQKPASLGAKNLTVDRQNAAAADKYAQELRDKNPNMSEDEIANKRAARYQELKTKSTPITANRADEIQGKIDRVDFAEGLTNDIDKLLLKHHAISGLGGTLTRPAEVIANLLGSNETDRKEFQRLVSEMQMVAPRILLDTNGRPMGAEAERLNTIIAGLRPGDTGPNTIRAYMDLRDQLESIKQRYRARLKETTPGAAPASGGSDWWKDPGAGKVHPTEGLL